MHPLEEHPVVLVGGHGQRRVPNPAVGGAPVAIRPRRSLASADHDDFTAVVHGNSLDRRERRRVDLPKLGAQLSDGALADLLARHSSVWRDTEQHQPAALVQEGTDCHGRLSARPGSGFELQRFRLAGCS